MKPDARPRPRSVPPITVEKQRAASDPAASAWVFANAGSGKTTVLSRRVVRLLLQGAPPERILCLTFTKAAAANMQNRIFAHLGRWATLPDAVLAAEIEDIEGRAPTPAEIVRARRIFAHAIETPGGLKILTIHAFCERVLHLFPFEANVPAGFTVLEERAADELLKNAGRTALAAGNAAPESAFGRSLARVIEEAGKESFAKLLDEIATRRGAIRSLLKDADTPAIAAARLARFLDVEGESVASLEEQLSSEALNRDECLAIAQALRDIGGDKNEGCAARLERAADAPDEAWLAAYLAVFLTQEGDLRAETFISKDARRRHPLMAGRLDAHRARVARYLERRKRCECYERSRALLEVADVVLQRYGMEKRNRAALDFDDLVSRAVALLQRAGAEWVLYKLDQGIDHILVDEAQDTSPEQWQIIERLAHEFTSGEGARAVARTMFAVGDEKQSIYSFQGAAPAEFDIVRRRFEQRVTAAGLDFRRVHLTHSFRSTPDVIEAVDLVFQLEANRRGLSSDPVHHPHETVRTGEPGRVEIWPIEKPDAAPPVEAWDAPFDAPALSSAPAKLARRIAAAVRTLINEGCPATGARFSAGDVMVLVRSRNQMFEALIRELRRADVPVAGADRLVLADHIAVMDLLALAHFVLLPADDLTLATVLKTPLIGFDDAHLIRLAPSRSGSLWQALESASDPDFRHAHEKLRRWIDQSAFQTPFSFFADVLGHDGGRRAIFARLGLEAGDALDEFLNLALAYERTDTPSLQGFLAWLGGARHEVKRDMDIARGEVRVMTVHGAKGLEAKLVILADTCGAPDARHHPKLFFVNDPKAPHTPPLMMWSPSQACDPLPAVEAREDIRKADDAEHRRLLYVAMTRAEDRLIIAGFEGERARRPGNWYDMVAGALRDAGARGEPMPDGAGERLIWERMPGVKQAPSSLPRTPPPGQMPEWTGRPAAPEAAKPSIVTPSSALQPSGEAGKPAPLAQDGFAILRGRLIHRLLQSLPQIAPQARSAAALRFLTLAAAEHADRHAGLAAEAMTILNDPEFGQAFTESSRAEVSLLGRVRIKGAEQIVSGRIDRLAITEDRVLILDFKTDRQPPARILDVPHAYLDQLALYRRLLAEICPGHGVEAALLWTARPRLMAIPASALDEAALRLGLD